MTDRHRYRRIARRTSTSLAANQAIRTYFADFHAGSALVLPHIVPNRHRGRRIKYLALGFEGPGILPRAFPLRRMFEKLSYARQGVSPHVPQDCHFHDRERERFLALLRQVGFK